MRSTEKIQTLSGTIKQSTRILPTILPDENDIFIRSNPAVSLYNLADKYYGDVNMWWIIAKANNLNSFIVTDGRILRIPINPNFNKISD